MPEDAGSGRKALTIEISATPRFCAGAVTIGMAAGAVIVSVCLVGMFMSGSRLSAPALLDVLLGVVLCFWWNRKSPTPAAAATDPRQTKFAAGTMILISSLGLSILYEVLGRGVGTPAEQAVIVMKSMMWGEALVCSGYVGYQVSSALFRFNLAWCEAKLRA